MKTLALVFFTLAVVMLSPIMGMDRAEAMKMDTEEKMKMDTEEKMK